MLGLLGLRILEACGANITDLGEEHGHRVLKVRGKGGEVVLTPLPPAILGAIDRAVAGAPTGRSCGTSGGSGWNDMPPPDLAARLLRRDLVLTSLSVRLKHIMTPLYHSKAERELGYGRHRPRTRSDCRCALVQWLR